MERFRLATLDRLKRNNSGTDAGLVAAGREVVERVCDSWPDVRRTFDATPGLVEDIGASIADRAVSILPR